ncbi:MAG: hypothetical protein KGI33_11955 [Thaumarchaeota archaeon]|nr:hypothetical protein [Nitrososphaerota archaeon]
MLDSRRHVTFFGEMTLDMSKGMHEIWQDVRRIAEENGYVVDMEFGVISLYREQDSKLYVTKIVPGRNDEVYRIRRLVFETTRASPIEEYEMAGIDGSRPVWKFVSG